MKIAVGNSRKDKKFKNKDISWEDFTKRLKNTIRTSETQGEYKNLSKENQDNIKDVGGFIGGHLKDNKRKKGNVLCRSILTLDMDYGRKNIWDEISLLFDFKCLIYSTHKHTKENPRLRLVIPLKREVTEEEYTPLSRMVAKEIGIDMFDDTTYEASRLMYWPSTSCDGEFIYEESKGKLLDPDLYLSKYENYKDASTWPVSSRQDTLINKELKNVADPLTKEGIVGIFCSTYNMEETIDKFLNNIYEKSVVENRYDYKLADSSAGLVIYDNKFAYSHHATDPASGILMNAFDIVRIHKFGHLDEKVSKDLSGGDLPSFKAMNKFAINDEKIKMSYIKQRMSKAKEEFQIESNEDDDNLWQLNLKLNNKGNIKEDLDNIVLILEKDKNLQSIAYNSHKDSIDVRGDLPWKQLKNGWSDSDISSLKVYLNKKYNIYSPNKTRDALIAVAAKRAYHPIKEYLENLPKWDEVSRLDNLLIDYFDAENNSYSKAVIRKTLVAAVGRIYNPGTKFDSVLILNGPQGIGKSTFFAKLGGNWFSDSLTITDMKDKCGPEKLQGYWVLELGELAGMRKTEVEIVKSFISRVDDKYRASYGVTVENHPRQCIIVGSTNAESGFLRDITGNRRFWPVKVNKNSKKKPWNLAKEEINQIWAEALYLYKKGEKLYLEEDELNQATKEQCDAMETDEREGLVRAYLDTLLPKEWDNMPLFERRNFLRGSEFSGSNLVGTEKRRVVCNMEIWCECFENEASKLRATDSYGISAIMKKLEGWDRYSGNKLGTRIVPIYGKQRSYERIIKEQV